MSRILILGGGVSGHTAALFARKALRKENEVVVVTPNSKWNWIPSNIWVGVGLMKPEQVTFALAPVYRKQGITYVQAKATALYPDGGEGHAKPFVRVARTDADRMGQSEDLEYDYVINATGPKLRFEATEGLGPEAHTLSVCTAGHAAVAAGKLAECIERMEQGAHLRFVIGTGHGTCTCQGAAFEYLLNVEHELRRHGVRERATMTYLTNESFVGDFGVAGLHIARGGYTTYSRTMTESLFAERDIDYITGAHVSRIGPTEIQYELLDGSRSSLPFDFSMLIPPFGGAGLKAFDARGADISDQLFAPSGFMYVDGDYQKKAFADWKAADWPVTYQNPKWPNIFAVGIAFAPPHPISKPMQSPNGTPISPAPPRTGMPSAMMGKAAALSIVDMIKRGATGPTHSAGMAQVGAACVASAGSGLLSGTAVAMTMYPVVPDYEKYPVYGRDTRYSFGEIGLAAHWIKLLLHFMFIYKAKAHPLWFVIPE